MQYRKLHNKRMDSWKREGRLLSERATAIEKELHTRLLFTKTGLLEAVQLEKEINVMTERRREVINDMALKLREVKVRNERERERVK